MLLLFMKYSTYLVPLFAYNLKLWVLPTANGAAFTYQLAFPLAVLPKTMCGLLVVEYIQIANIL